MFWLFLGAVNFLRVLGHLQCFKPIRDFLDRCCSSCVISCQDCANVAFGKVKAGCGACFGWLGMHCGVLLRGMKTICNKGVQRWKASCSAKPGASDEDEAVDQRGVVRTLFFTLYHAWAALLLIFQANLARTPGCPLLASRGESLVVAMGIEGVCS